MRLTLAAGSAVVLGVLLVGCTAGPAATGDGAAESIVVEQSPTGASQGLSPGDGFLPTSANTGPRVDRAQLTEVPRFESSRDGEVIEGLSIQRQLKITHSNVVVRDTLIRFDGTSDGQYPIHITKACSDCPYPENVLLEHVEVEGQPGAALGPPAIYGPRGNWTLRFAHIHGMGSGPRLTHNTRVEYSYIHGMPDGDPEEHKSGVGLNGGTGNAVIGNNISCDVAGCSAALSLYGQNGPVKDVLVAGNLFNTTGSYCVYGGSVASKDYPLGEGVVFLDNKFGREFNPDCGLYGPVTAFSARGEGNAWERNVWADTGEPVGPEGG